MKRRTYLKGMASAGALATVGATGVTAAPGDGSDVLVVDDATGDNNGDGDLVHPTSGDFYDGVWDLTRFRIGQDSSRIHFDFEIDSLQNPFGLGDGWSHEYFQVYIRDPNADSSAPTATSGLSDALNVDFAEPYQYVLLAHGEGYQALNDAGGNEAIAPRDTNVTVSGTTVSVSIPRTTISDISQVQMTPLVTPYDGFGTGSMRAIQSDAAEYAIGGGDENTPKVMDMVVPQGENQSDVLTAASRFDNPVLPYLDLGSSGGPPDVAGNTPTNLDNDDLFEDVDGDGDGDVGDVLTYYNNRNSAAVRNNPQYFDFDGDGSPGTVFDALELYNKIQGL